jgi:hypothetical protein
MFNLATIIPTSNVIFFWKIVEATTNLSLSTRATTSMKEYFVSLSETGFRSLKSVHLEHHKLHEPFLLHSDEIVTFPYVDNLTKGVFG